MRSGGGCDVALWFGEFAARLWTILNRISAEDVLALAGLALLGYGLYLISIPLAFIVLGMLMLAAAVLRVRRAHEPPG